MSTVAEKSKTVTSFCKLLLNRRKRELEEEKEARTRLLADYGDDPYYLFTYAPQEVVEYLRGYEKRIELIQREIGLLKKEIDHEFQ